MAKANKPIGESWRHGRARRQLSTREAAVLLRCSEQYLRNIESEQPKATPSLHLAYRAVELYRVPINELLYQGGDNTNDGVPDEPPEQPKREPTSPPTRRDEKGTGPKRARGVAA